MRVVAGLDQRAAAVMIDEQVVGVAGEQQFGGARVLQLDRRRRDCNAGPRRRNPRRPPQRRRLLPWWCRCVEAKRRSSGEDMRGDCS